MRNNTGQWRIAVFASGRGSNLEALLESIDRGDLTGARIVLVISNNSASGALETARKRSIATAHISSRTHPERGCYEHALLDRLEGAGIDLILLAGYMKMFPACVVRAYHGRILNIHPALLPRHGGAGMYGLNVHRAVLDSGDRQSGATVHLVNERYDEGRIVLQRRVPVLPDDTPERLAARVLEVEHDLYWRAVRQVMAERAGESADEEELR